jgi:hemerythrin superfamily protein
MASKTAGAGRSAAKALAGYPGIFHHLAGEHAEVSTRMKRVAGTMEIQVRQELFPDIRRQLLAHARGEERVFYPVLRELPELQGLVAQCLDDHAELEQYLNRLDVKDKSTKHWGDLFEEMVRAVEAHVAREEQELFPRARDVLTGQQAKEMEARYQQLEERDRSP